jgi:AraC family transcriptional regulator, transcriptional activator of the genes for pyochelin and ferripyochelin receptors
LEDGFLISFAEANLHVRRSIRMSVPDAVLIYISSSGDGEHAFPKADPLSFQAPSAAVIIEPPGCQPAEVTFVGSNRYVSVLIHRKVLARMFAGNECELPDELRSFLRGDLRQAIARPLPLNAALLRCLEDLHGCTLERHRRRLFLESRAVDIVCQAIDALAQSEGCSAPEGRKTAARGVLEVQRALEENFITPPPLDDLAHEIGMSRSGLTAAFREILGHSVYGYAHNLRMQHALAMLNERDVSISQIAYALGYGHASSFSVAVQRHFGITPTELRQRGLQAS